MYVTGRQRHNQALLAPSRKDEKAIVQMLRGLQEYQQILEASESRHAEGLAFDRLREGAVSPVGDSGSILEMITGNLEMLESWIADARIAESVRGQPNAGAVLDLETRGLIERVPGDKDDRTG